MSMVFFLNKKMLYLMSHVGYERIDIAEEIHNPH